jgi:hypothetical protein
MPYYLEIAKSVGSENMLHKGQKLYLDGKVLYNQDLKLIPNWYVYTVTDNIGEYQLIVPAIHLLTLDNPEALFFKLAKCECEYYRHYGFCTHLMGVLSHFDDRFCNDFNNPQAYLDLINSESNLQDSSDQNLNPLESLWGKISKPEVETLVSHYSYLFRSLLEYDKSTTWSNEIIIKNFSNLPRDLLKYPKLVGVFEQFLNDCVVDYTNQNKLIALFTNPYLGSIDTITWFNYFAPFYNQININHTPLMLYKIFCNYKSKIYDSTNLDKQQFKTTLSALFGSFDSNLVLEPVFKMLLLLPNNSYVDFGIMANLPELLMVNCDQLEPDDLIKIAKKFDDHREFFELKIFSQVKIISDFLGVGDYNPLLQLIDQWFVSLGNSKQFEEAVLYIQQNNSTRRKLAKELEAYL